MRIARCAALSVADGLLLVAAWPDVPRCVRALGDVSAWVDRVGPDRAAAELAGAALWCLAGWLAVGLVAGVLSGLPGTVGRFADRLARGALPAAVYRIAAGAAGLGVALAPAAAAVAATPVPAASAPSPVWPSDRPLPAPCWPVTATTRPGAHSEPHSPRHHPPPSTAAPVVVAPGDSLWSIAAAHLPSDAGPQRIAREWPRWYGANRAVVGADPALIRPGQVLHAPTNPPEDRP